MTKSFVLRILAAFVVALVPLAALFTPVYAGPTDTIREYVITVTPGDNGFLTMDYSLNWCPLEDFPADHGYIEVGVANSQFTLNSFGGTGIKSAKAENKGGWSGVRLDLNQLYKANECFTAVFQISQGRMAHKKDKNEVSFQFIPGWFDEIPVEHLVVNWKLPEDAKLVHLMDPQPAKVEGSMATWEKSNLSPGEKYTVNILYDAAVFPNLSAEAQASEGGDALSILVIVVIVVVIVILAVGVWVIVESDDYGGGSSFGGYHGGSSFGGSFGSSSGRSGGGDGGFSGRGSSCACVSSCACACACAGGGRVGCSGRGFYIPKMMPGSSEEGGTSEKESVPISSGDPSHG